MAERIALLVAGLNKINLCSDNSMYRQIFSEASIKPPNFERDFRIASGFSPLRRNKIAVMQATKRLARRARQYIIENYELDKLGDRGFLEMIHGIRF